VTDRHPDEAIEAFVAWLMGAGYKIRRDEFSERDFGNWLRELAGQEIAFRIVRERFNWYIEIAPIGGGWYGIQEWSSCLRRNLDDGVEVSRAIDFVKENLGRIQAAARNPTSIESCLRQAHQRLITAQLDVPPGVDLSLPAVLRPPINAAAIRRQAAERLARQRKKKRT